ncbi:MAG TPA: hypothetical protein VMM92_16295 [Thermoanaerobaculia bacterium]|nr:hypothetical protein [Thermoanaerobaculia bacterium]
MPSLRMLDSLIAMVGVILILSLIVQSLQSAFKKFLKIKSRQIEDSLLDLFQNALGLPGNESHRAISPLLRIVTNKPTTFRANPEAKVLFDAVSAKFRDIGRVAQSGRWILDSLAKDDLLKVLARVAPTTLLPDFVAKMEDACRQVYSLEAALAQIQGDVLSGEANAHLAALRQALSPLINDVKSIYKGNPLALDPALLVGDAMKLREVKLEDVLALLAQVQKEIDRDLASARQAAAPAAQITALEAASDGLKKVAAQLTALRSRFDLAIAPLRSRLQSVESWFDTVMQSFEERYTRGMKTWALVLSFLVVVLLNANFFKLAHQILSASPTELAKVVDTDQALVQANQQVPAKKQAPAPAVATEPAQATATEPPQATATEPAQASEAAAPQATESPKQIVQQTRNDVQKNLSTYYTLGFGPLVWDQTYAEVFPQGFLATLAGWLLMTMLLSAGAPFWEDILESLFGLKNLLRKNNAQQNVEQAAGTGNPQS